MTERIRVEGLRELNAKLRRLDRDLPKGLRLAGNAAAEIVVHAAQPRVPRRTGRAAGSIKKASTRTAARVQGGGARVPYYPWLDFGGRVGRRHSVHRPFLKEGRYIWAAFAENRERVQVKLREELVKVGNEAGLRVR